MSTNGNRSRWVGKPNSGKPRFQNVIDQYLKEKGLRRKSIAKDGCCLFRAVAEQVYLTQTTHWELRRQCAAYIKKNPGKFKLFLTIPLKSYCWQLANCNLWGGEMELVALAELLERDFVIYQEQGGKLTPSRIECSKKTTRGPEILLLFTGNEHYDSLWESEEESAASISQSILYELLVQTVLDTKMKQAEKRDAIRLRGMDFNRRGSYDRPPAVLERYPDDMLRGLSTWSYFNVAYRVWKRDREASERADRRLALSIQFRIGDQCLVTVEGKQYKGDILTGLHKNIVEVFVKDLTKRVKVPVSDLRLVQQNGRSKSGSRGRHGNRTGGKGEVVTVTTVNSVPRKSYSKNGKPQNRQQQSNTIDKNETQAGGATATRQNDREKSTPNVNGHAFVEPVVEPSKPRVDELLQDSTRESYPEDQQLLQPQPFSETTVRMSSLMGLQDPLHILNQASLGSINDAPESEWPILNAGCGSGRGHHGNVVIGGSNPQRCHLDGPPPLDAPPQLPFSVYSHDPARSLIQEMDPPIHLLKTGTTEGRQQFMYEFAQNSLRLYSKYVSDPELEDAISELLCMQFEDFITPPSHYTQGDFSVATSLTSREGSQLDVRDRTPSDNYYSHTPRISEEDRTSSDTHSPVEVESIPAPPLRDVPISPVGERGTDEGAGIPSVPLVPASGSDGTPQEEGSVPVSPFQPPMMFTPGAPPYPYPYPMMFPGPMYPWCYPPMGAGPFMVPPHLLPQMRGVPIVSSPTNEEGVAIEEIDQQKQVPGEVTMATMPDQVEETPTPKQEDGTNEETSTPQQDTPPVLEEEGKLGEQGEGIVKQDSITTGDDPASDTSDSRNKTGKNTKTRSFIRHHHNNQQHRRYYGNKSYTRNNKIHYGAEDHSRRKEATNTTNNTDPPH